MSIRMYRRVKRCVIKVVISHRLTMAYSLRLVHTVTLKTDWSPQFADVMIKLINPVAWQPVF